MNIAQPRPKAFYADAIAGREPRVLRVRVLAVTAGMLLSIGAVAMLAIGIVTAFQARRLYAACATGLGRTVLRLYGIDLRIHGAPPWPSGQHVYISNHTSTLDVFILVALGLPNTRFFLSGFLRRFVPLGIIQGRVPSGDGPSGADRSAVHLHPAGGRSQTRSRCEARYRTRLPDAHRAHAWNYPPFDTCRLQKK